MQNNELIQEDEIDLRQLFSTIWKYKKFIFIFIFIATTLSIFYAMSKPNVYESKAVFSPIGGKNDSKIIPKDLEGFVTLSFGQNIEVYETYKQLLNSFKFTKTFIIKYKLYEDFSNTNNYIYPFSLFNQTNQSNEFGQVNEILTQEQEKVLFSIYKNISANLKISKDKKTNLVNFTYKSPDRFLNKKIIDSFLEYSGKYLKLNEISKIEQKIKNLNNEIVLINNIDLKNKMLELKGTIYKRKVFLQAEDYSGLKVIILPEVSYIKAKSGPKRSLIVIVTGITSLILSIFLVFLIEFIMGNKEENTLVK